ncbi:unnamed protein product [Didymodactylos carnosus]|uniref:Transmembrane protein n=1 Tax=Didymodactylos carnosus TaxID=1234261 RepID=A0A814NX82_9BILA|nr:unnamed protein product [Didymodactylos carnosus]CAF1098228.1 unnamed protein product [Didymodactylos carnosus]CAF3664563.1 unnamed protein product [Didymodactylos carnosus]CAF3863270.1 unnamed protein product [Didymodactylos carnosus]
MFIIYLWLVLPLVCSQSTSNVSEFTAYGSKIAVNNVMIVEVYNDRHQFGVEFASAGGSTCISDFENSSYIYSVALGKYANVTSFAYIGKDKDTKTLFISSTTVLDNCTFTPPNIFSFNSSHSDHYLLAVNPTGQFLFGFSNDFILVWEPENQFAEKWTNNITYAQQTFVPYAVDVSQDFALVVGSDGFTGPIAYLLHFNSCNIITSSFETCMTVVDVYVYNTSGTGVSNMSVKINDAGHVLWSIGSINKVILMSIVNVSLNVISTINNIGEVKAVAWMTSTTCAFLLSSQIQFYQITNGTFTYSSTFPNTWKTLCSTMTPNFVTIAMSDTIGLAILDVNGYVYVIRPTTIGYYSVTSTGCGTKIRFAYSKEAKCLPGYYHSETSARPCALCPSDTYNSGENYVECVPCSNSSFCPLGSVADVDSSAMTSIVQARAYPVSPESTLFDDILLQNMFNMSFSRHCLLVSPLFWTLLIIACALLVLTVMGISKFFVQCKDARQTIKYVFKQTDLIGEGELWIGGIVSFSVLVLVSFAYAFSTLYLKQYPIETSADSAFACNTNLRNSKFSTQMQLLGIPLSDEIQPLFDMLDAQAYMLNVDFVNTYFHCSDLIIQQTVGTVVSVIPSQNCSQHSAILSVAVALPLHTIAIQLSLNGTRTIGGMRVGLSGPAASNEEYTVQELNFMQGYMVQNRTLSQNPSLQLQLIRLINDTEPLSESDKTIFSALWIPTFSYVSDQLFLTETQYFGNTRSQTLLTVSLSEKAYYVINTQSPIAKQAEVVFHSILFTIVCLELFGLLFVIFKLVFVPLFRFVVNKFQRADAPYELTPM